MSVGGTTMKLFDIRQNVTLSVTDHAYPYSTLAISPCENFCCVGDMKGSIMSYDLRNIKNALQSNSCHEGSVTNLRFLPCSLEAELPTEDHIHEDNSDIDSVERKKSKIRRTSAQEFFDEVATSVAPAKQQNDRRRSIDDFFSVCTPSIPTNDETTKTVSNDLNTVPEENTMSESSNSNENSKNQASMDCETTASPFDLQGPTLTFGSSEMPGRKSLYSDHVVYYSNQNHLTSQDENERNNQGKDHASAHCNAAVMSQMNDMSEKFEEKLQNMEIMLNDKLMIMERKFEAKLEEKVNDLSDQILHGFRSIHCNLWTVAETDIKDTKNMIAKIHENYSKIEDVFIENILLKEQLLKLKTESENV